MSEVKLDETYWKCDVCGERMPQRKEYLADIHQEYYGYWNIPAERHEMVFVKPHKATHATEVRNKVLEKKPAVLTICDKCIERLKNPLNLLSENHSRILSTIEDVFTGFPHTGDAYVQVGLLGKAIGWLKTAQPWKFSDRVKKYLKS